MKSLSYYPLNGFLWLSYKLKSVAMHMTHWTGKSPVPIHPKHLLGTREDMYWYLTHLSPNDTLLDVGCGNGMHTLKASAKVKQATGIELNEKNHRDALALKKDRGVSNVEFILGSAVEKKLPFPDNSFDKVMCMDVLEHIHERQALLKEIRRVLKPTGTMIFSVPSCESRWRGRLRNAGVFAYSDPDHKVEYTRESLREELAQGGFKPTEWFTDVYDTPWVGFIDFVGGFSLKAYARLQEWKVSKGQREPQECIGFKVLCQPA